MLVWTLNYYIKIVYSKFSRGPVLLREKKMDFFKSTNKPGSYGSFSSPANLQIDLKLLTEERKKGGEGVTLVGGEKTVLR